METANLVVSIIALVLGIMAIPTIFQMFFGRPRLTFEADDFTGSQGRVLALAIKNEPITNRFLRFIGVEREAGDVLAFFDVQEQGTGKVIARPVSGRLQCVPLPTIGCHARSLPGFIVGLIIISTREGNASIVDARPEKDVPISQGHYTAHISIIRGQYTYKIAQNFRVGKADHETDWDQRCVVVNQWQGTG